MLNTPRQGLKAGLPVWKAMARNPIGVNPFLSFKGDKNVLSDEGAVSNWSPQWELIVNGDMDLEANWTAFGSYASTVRSTEQVRSLSVGAYSRRVQTADSSGGMKSDTFAVTAGKTYRVEVWYYISALTATSIRFRLQDGDGSDVGALPSDNTTTGSWVNFIFNIKAETTGSASYFQVYQNGSGGATFYIDDVSVKESTAPSSGLKNYLKQNTADLKPTHVTANKLLTFDVVPENQDKLAFNVAVAQAGVLVTATSNGIFAYEVNADSVAEITALGKQTGYYQNLNLYAYILFPTSITDVELAGVIRYLVENTNATKNPVGNLTNYWHSRADLMTPKLGGIDFSGVTNFSNAWQSCTSMTSFLATGLDSGTNFANAWRSCTSLATMPAIPLTAGTNFNATWYGDTSLTSFLATGLDSGTNLSYAWSNCTALATMPAIPLTAGTDFNNAWAHCTSLTSFLATGLDSGTAFNYAWNTCTALTTFPAIPLTAGTNFANAWQYCSQLESFPALDLSSGTNFSNAWNGCSDALFTSFPAVTFSTDADDDINFSNAWKGCTALTSFPSVNLSRGTNFTSTWQNCAAITSFPSDVDLSNGTQFAGTWASTRSVSFPALDLSAGTNFTWCWSGNSAMVSFGACNMNAGDSFESAWDNHTALTTFPAGVFDDWNPASITTKCFKNTWGDCTALTEQSVENILLSIAASGVWATATGTSNGTPLVGKSLVIDSTATNVENLNPATRAACTALQSRGWEVMINNSIVSEYSVRFDGSNEYVDADYKFSTMHSTGITMSYWVKMDNFTGNQVMGSWDDKGCFAGFSGTNAWWAIQNVQDAGTDISSYIEIGKWHHICITGSGASGVGTFYLDGVSRDTLAYTADAARASVTGIAVGALREVSGASNYMEGDIDEVAIWNVALDADAVASVYNSGSPTNLGENGLWPSNYDNSGDLVSWWRMGDSDSGAGNFVTDVIATDGEALHLPAVAGNYASVPDAADLDGFGDFTIQADDVTLSEWDSGAYQALVTKYNASGNQRAWALMIHPSGNIYIDVSLDGGLSATAYVSTALVGLADGATASIRVIRTGSTITFQMDTGSGFAALGAAVAGSATALPNINAPVEIGTANGGTSYSPSGSIGRARVWSDATQTTNVLDVNFALANKGATSFTATSGQVVTVHSTAIDNPAAIRGATDGVLVNGPTFVVDNPPNYSDYSLSFDGTDQYVAMNVPALNDTLTASAWVKYDATAADYDYIISFGTGSTLKMFSMARQVTTNKIYCYHGSGELYGPALPVGEWVHVAMVVKPTTDRLTLYINGIEETIDQPSGDFDLDASPSTGTIGSYLRSAHYAIDLIDEVAIWDTALTSAQINDIYNGGVPADLTSLSPVSWWRMGDGTSDGFGTHGSRGADYALVEDVVTTGLGAEVLADTSFNDASAWTVYGVGGGETYDVNTTNAGKITAILAHDADMKQDGVMTSGQLYLLEVTVDSYSGTGGFRGVGHMGTWNVNPIGVGAFKHYFRASGADFSLRVEHDIGFTATAISLKPVLGNAGLLINSSEAAAISRSVPAEDAKWNNRSLEFAASNTYMDCGTGTGNALANNYAGSLSVSLWFKADVTNSDDGLFSIGTFAVANGEVDIRVNSGELKYGLNGQAWNREVAFTDTASWHHLVCVYATGSEADSKMYLDGVAVGATTGTFPVASAMDFAGLKTIIGAWTGTSWTFDGKIDEVGIFHSELSASQVLQIYNGGKPASLKEHSPDSWYRMGDDDDTGGTTIRDLGYVINSEMVINGTFDSGAGWDGSEAGWTFTGGKAVATEAANSFTLQRYDGGTLVVGELYHIKFTVSDYLEGSIRAQLDSMVGPTITANGDYSMNVVCTSATANKIAIQSTSASTTLKIDNFSVKQGELIINGSMDIDDNWNDFGSSPIQTRSNEQAYSGTYSRKVVGSASGAGVKSDNLTVTAGQTYAVEFWSYRAASGGSVLVRLQDGNASNVGDYQSLSDVTGSWRHHMFYTTVENTGSLSVFKTYQNGSTGSTYYIDSVSVRQVNGNPATLVNTPTFSTDTP